MAPVTPRFGGDELTRTVEVREWPYGLMEGCVDNRYRYVVVCILRFSWLQGWAPAEPGRALFADEPSPLGAVWLPRDRLVGRLQGRASLA